MVALPAQMSQLANGLHLNVCVEQFLSSLPRHSCWVSSRTRLGWSQKALLWGGGIYVKDCSWQEPQNPQAFALLALSGLLIPRSTLPAPTFRPPDTENSSIVVLPLPPIHHIQELAPFSLSNLDRPLFHLPILVRVTAVSCSPKLERLALSVSLPCLPSPLWLAIQCCK